MKKMIAGALSALLVAGGLTLAVATTASATVAEECVPREAVPAWTEVVPDIEHPAVYETVVVTPATEGTPAVWANFSPNDQHATFVGPAAYPVDERGTWHDHGTLPPGQAGPDGVYANGNPDKGGNWFYRQAAVEGTPEVTEERVVTEAYTEVIPDIEHPEIPAVTCEPEEPMTYTPSCTTVTDAATIEGDGIITVPGGWASSTISVPFSGTLADIGTVLDIQADPIQYVGLHIRTGEGSISFEEEPSYGGSLWSTAEWEGVSAGMGYAAFGSIADYIEFNGDVTVNAIDLLYTHPEASSTTVTSFTIGCTTYTFVPPVIVPEKPADIVTVDEVSEIDCEAGTVTTTTTTTTTGHVLVDNAWVEAEPVITLASSQREASDVECPPVVTPEEPVEPEEPVTPAEPVEPVEPVDEPAQEKPTARVASEPLAATGSESSAPLLWLAGILAALGTGAVVARSVIARRH